jgi:CRISPR-associated endonuclease Csn1
MNQTLFAFDLGKASMGICARTETSILELKSINIPVEYAMTSDFRGRRRAERTRQAHKKREEWLCSQWRKVGLPPLPNDDERMKREFPRKGDETIYNSALLRVALIQNNPLQDWQIFKALWSSIQLRGYDSNLPWANNYTESTDEAPESQSKDEQENRESAERYKERLHEVITPHFQYEYPCFLEASLMGLWSSDEPQRLKLRIDHAASKVRRKPGALSSVDPGNVAPRELVEKEIRTLLENAMKQLPQLQAIDIDEWLYGPSKSAYASYKQAEYKKYRGQEWDTQGLLSQKVPRFDNRIIGKCQLLPTRNTCKASDPLSVCFTVLMKLKNLRFTDGYGEYDRGLFAEELPKAHALLMENLAGKKSRELTYNQVFAAVKKAIGTDIKRINMESREKFRINTSGRARFSRPALKLMIDILLSGQNPPEFDLTPYITTGNANPITRAELEKAVSRLGKTWAQFSVGDDRYNEVLEQSPIEREQAIFKAIGSVNNPIVRHRLTVFYNELKRMTREYGEPGWVILEFIRGSKDGLEGRQSASDYDSMIKRQEVDNDRLRDDLAGMNYPVTRENLLRLRLLREQQGHCVYSGNPLVETQIHLYQVDHIVPISQEMSTDALYNKVLVIPSANQEKQNRTPYEWLSSDPERWAVYQARIMEIKSIGKKKRELLLSKDARDLVNSYNGLAETAYMARLAQQIVSLHYGWGLQTEGDKRRVFVSNGRETAKIRGVYKLNELLLSDEERASLKPDEKAKKKRSNPKHHALDAYCISYSQSLRPKQKADGEWRWEAEGLERTRAEFERKLLDLFPNNPLRNRKEIYPQETIYGYKARIENGNVAHYLTVHKNLVDLLAKDRKKIKDIWDEDVRVDLERLSKAITDKDAWLKALQTYQHPKRKSLVKRVLIVETEGTLTSDSSGRQMIGEFKDFGKGATKGQYKHSKQHNGQIIYFDDKNKPKVRPVYGHQSLKLTQKELQEKNFKLYNQGMLFYSGAEIVIPKEFGQEGKKFPAGLYKLRTIKSKGDVKIENNAGEDIDTNIKYLVEAGFTLNSYHVRTEQTEGVST